MITKTFFKNSFIKSFGKYSPGNIIKVERNILVTNLFKSIKFFCTSNSEIKNKNYMNDNKNIDTNYVSTLPIDSTTSEINSSNEIVEEYQNSELETKVYFFGNDEISLPTLQQLFTIYNNDKKGLSNNSSSEFEVKKPIKIVDLEVISTPWGQGNKTQASFHSFIKQQKLSLIEVIDDWTNLLNTIKNSSDYKLVSESIEECEITQTNTEHNNKTTNNNEYNEDTNKSIKVTKKITRKVFKRNSNIAFILSFGKMIPKEVIDIFEQEHNKGIFVIHPSLLPKYRGGAPIQHAILNKETQTGISLIYTSTGKFDAGDILMQKQVEIQSYYRFKELAAVLSIECAKIVKEFIEDYYNIKKEGKKIKQENKEEDKILYKKHFAKIIKDKYFVYLDMVNESTEQIILKYRAFYGSQLVPWSKVQYNMHIKYVFFDNLTKASDLIVNKLEVDQNVIKYVKPGSLYWDFNKDDKFIYIKTLDGWLVSNSVKIEGYGFLNPQELVQVVFKLKKVDKVLQKTNANFLIKESIIEKLS